MLMTYADLHMHSTASDGADAPEALPQLAKTAELSAIALTDHDTTAGLRACAVACKKAKIAFVPGIELSADPGPVRPDGESRGTLHVLGYFIDPDDPQLAEVQVRLVAAREQRNPQMVDRLRELGVDITYDEVRQIASTNVVGRPHLAQVLLDKGYVRSIHEAFERYLGARGAAYIRKDRLSPADAIAVIHHAGGLAVLAHPVQLGLDDAGLDHAVARLCDLGLDGLETRHSDHTADMVQKYAALARRRNLLTTGGSDYHGPRKVVKIGEAGIDEVAFNTLRAASRSS